MKYGSLDVDKMFAGSFALIWVIIRNLVLTLTVLLLLSITTTRFEVVALCLLILILVHQTGFESLLAYGSYDHNVYMLKQFHYVLKGLNADDAACSALQTTIARSDEILNALKSQQLINYVFYYFLWAVLLWKIISVI